MAKGDDLWGDKPALGPGSKFGGEPAGAPADLPGGTPADIPTPVDLPAATLGDAPARTSTRLDIEGDRIDGMSKIDLEKKQAYELTSIRMLLEQLNDRIDEITRARGPEQSDDKSKVTKSGGEVGNG